MPARPTRPARRLGAAAAALALVLAACSTTGGSDGASSGSGGSDGSGSDPSTQLDTTAAAASLQTVVDAEDEPDFCPLGTPDALIGTIAEDLDVAEDLALPEYTGVDVFDLYGADIVQCELSADPGQSGTVDLFTVLASPSGDVEVDAYATGTQSTEGATDTRSEDFGGGTAEQWCWDGGECLTWWQSPDLLVAVSIASFDGTIDPADAQAAARKLVPLVVDGLADGSATTRYQTSDGGDDAGFDTAAAADTAQAAIDEGDSLGECPMGTPAELIDATDGDPLLAPGLAEDIDDGQVFRGGEVDITYCSFFASADEPGQIEDLRVDVAPGADIDIDTYLDEEFVDPEDVASVEVDPIPGGATSAACWDDDEDCGVFWQGDDLFIAIVGLTDGGTLAAEDLAVVAAQLIPVAGANLAAG